MATRMSNASRMDRIRAKGRISRQENGLLKRKERANRDKRMAALVSKGTFPYTPVVMNWLSDKLNKPASEISQEEAAAVKI